MVERRVLLGWVQLGRDQGSTRSLLFPGLVGVDDGDDDLVAAEEEVLEAKVYMLEVDGGVAVRVCCPEACSCCLCCWKLLLHSAIERTGAGASPSARKGRVVENCRQREGIDDVELVHLEAARPAKRAVCMGRSSIFCGSIIVSGGELTGQ